MGYSTEEHVTMISHPPLAVEGKDEGGEMPFSREKSKEDSKLPSALPDTGKYEVHAGS